MEDRPNPVPFHQEALARWRFSVDLVKTERRGEGEGEAGGGSESSVARSFTRTSVHSKCPLDSASIQSFLERSANFTGPHTATGLLVFSWRGPAVAREPTPFPTGDKHGRLVYDQSDWQTFVPRIGLPGIPSFRVPSADEFNPIASRLSRILERILRRTRSQVDLAEMEDGGCLEGSG